MKCKHKHLPFPPKNPSAVRAQRNNEVSSTVRTGWYYGRSYDPAATFAAASCTTSAAFPFWASEEKGDASLQRC